MRTLISKTLFTSASALSIAALLLVGANSASAQETSETMEMETEATEVVDTEIEADETSEVEGDARLGQSFEEDGDMEMEATDMDNDIDSDFDSDDDGSDEIEAETYSAPTYSNSPRALW